MTPASITHQLNELQELVERHPTSIPVTAVARFLGIKSEGLRNSMMRGTCPFGLSWKLGDRAAFCIPTPTFYAWYTGCALTDLPSAG